MRQSKRLRRKVIARKRKRCLERRNKKQIAQHAHSELLKWARTRQRNEYVIEWRVHVQNVEKYICMSMMANTKTFSTKNENKYLKRATKKNASKLMWAGMRDENLGKKNEIEQGAKTEQHHRINSNGKLHVFWSWKR